jgi:thiamine-phosphate diphosphorylase/hydroxyethylthiazole kinase
MASSDPAQASRDLKRLIENPPHFASGRPIKAPPTTEEIYTTIPGYVQQVVAQKPLCHNMINTVVQTLAANIAIAIGGSPIMSSNGSEAEDLAGLNGSLVINMGTVTPESLSNFLLAISAYNAAGNPVLLDPVGAGATSARRTAVKALMAGGYYHVIKGNEGEIKTVAGTLGTEQQHGVDSGASTLTLEQKAKIVQDLAAQEQCVVLMTGQVDILSDGSRTAYISNGHEYMGLVTGSGCTLGTTIAAFLAVHRDDMFMAALAAILLFEIAAEIAAEDEIVKGPGTFLPTWVDQLYQISQSSTETSAKSWIRRAKVDFK